MIKAKKYWGQHFLNDQSIAEKIAYSLKEQEVDHVLEIGPGKGVLTQYLIKEYGKKFSAVEIDRELFHYLLEKFPSLQGRLISSDILKFNIAKELPGSLAVIGNFPYNISSQIIFKVLENKEQVREVVGMFQKEMAHRIIAQPGGKEYGIISVLSQCYYDIELLFDLEKEAFSPPPKIQSSVIRLTRNEVTALNCDEQKFKQIVKMAFGKRRKKLRNSLRGLMADKELSLSIFDLRPEQLSIAQFIELTQLSEANS